MKILITSIGTTTGVNLIRYFKKLNQTVIGTDINDYGLTAGSQLVDKFVKVPLAIESEYFIAICNIIRDEKVDVIIPINDIEVYILSKRISEIPCECIIPETKTIEILRDKLVCNKKMSEIGVPVPEEIKSDLVYEKRILRDRIGVGSKGIKVIEAGSPAPVYDEEEKFLQKFITGEEYTIDILADRKGKPIYIVPRRRIEVKSGVATKVAIVEEDKLIMYAKKILDKFCIPGFSNIQFIKDKEGKYWFIEVNYRFSGCGAATLAATEGYLNEFIGIVQGDKTSDNINQNVKWNSIVTRYYEEILYENSIS